MLLPAKFARPHAISELMKGATTNTRASATLCVTSHNIVHKIRLKHLKNVN